MTQEDIKKYISENLKIEFYPYKSCDETYLGVRILLEGEEISANSSFVKYY